MFCHHKLLGGCSSQVERVSQKRVFFGPKIDPQTCILLNSPRGVGGWNRTSSPLGSFRKNSLGGLCCGNPKTPDSKMLAGGETCRTAASVAPSSTTWNELRTTYPRPRRGTVPARAGSAPAGPRRAAQAAVHPPPPQNARRVLVGWLDRGPCAEIRCGRAAAVQPHRTSRSRAHRGPDSPHGGIAWPTQDVVFATPQSHPPLVNIHAGGPERRGEGGGWQVIREVPNVDCFLLGSSLGLR